MYNPQAMLAGLDRRKATWGPINLQGVKSQGDSWTKTNES